MKAGIKTIIFISCLCYFFVGSLFTTTGVFIPTVGSYYNIDPASLGYLYSYLNAGIFITIALSGYAMKFFDMRKLLISCSLLVIAAIVMLNFFHTQAAYSAVMLLMGAVGGFIMSSGVYIVTHAIADHNRRASKLIFTDFFFSFSGMTLPVIFGSLLAKNVSWFFLYNIIMIPCVLIVLTLMKTEFRLISDEEKQQAPEKWNLNFYLIALSAFFFILAELGLMMWIVKYLQAKLQISLEAASFYLTLYWTSKAIGLFINQFTVLKLGMRRYLVTSVIVGMVAVSVFSEASTAMVATASIAIFGFVNSGIFATMIGHGCAQLNKPSPKAVAFIILCSTGGTLMSAWSTGLVAQYFGLGSVAKFAVCIYFLCMFFACASMFARKAYCARTMAQSA